MGSQGHPLSPEHHELCHKWGSCGYQLLYYPQSNGFHLENVLDRETTGYNMLPVSQTVP